MCAWEDLSNNTTFIFPAPNDLDVFTKWLKKSENIKVKISEDIML